MNDDVRHSTRTKRGFQSRANSYFSRAWMLFIVCMLAVAGSSGGAISGAPVVSEHYSSGEQLKTKYYANTNDSCVNCHNMSEMLTTNNASGKPKSTYATVSHYGSNKTGQAPYISDGSANCTYCHRNTSTAFASEMNDAAWNSSIGNHSSLGTNPACTNCHSTGRIHDSTLTKPILSLPNSTYCTSSCHGTGGSATIKNLSRHNGTVDCSECHMSAARNIHPVQYRQPDNAFKDNSPENKSSAVNCTNCHLGAGMSEFNNEAPIIPDTLKHSSSLSNGSIWGTYWTTENGACYYCHGSTKHNYTSALGKIDALRGDSNNTKNGALTTTTWCADCHLNGTNPNYRGNQWNPEPPLITVNNTGKPGWKNHSRYLSGGYKDSVCHECHALNGSFTTNSKNYSHSLDAGVSGGPDCIQCHNTVTGLSGGVPGGVNFTAANMSVHYGLNSNTATGKGYAPVIGACWACHGDGNEPVKHPANYLDSKPCEYCHVSNNFNAPLVYRHYPGAVFAGSRVYDNSDPNRTCVACHNNSVVANLNLTYGTYEAKNATVSHYAVNRTLGESLEASGGVTAALPNTRNTTESYGCDQCHAVGGTGGIYGPDYGSARSIPYNHNRMGSTGFPCQVSCHNSNPDVNVTLHDSNVGIYVGSSGCYAPGCHTEPSTGGRRRR